MKILLQPRSIQHSIGIRNSIAHQTFDQIEILDCECELKSIVWLYFIRNILSFLPNDLLTGISKLQDTTSRDSIIEQNLSSYRDCDKPIC